MQRYQGRPLPTGAIPLTPPGPSRTGVSVGAAGLRPFSDPRRQGVDALGSLRAHPPKAHCQSQRPRGKGDDGGRLGSDSLPAAAFTLRVGFSVYPTVFSLPRGTPVGWDGAGEGRGETPARDGKTRSVWEVGAAAGILRARP